MGQRFGHDFSQVRVHTGAVAERSAQDINANAYTVGRNIVFGAGQFAPQTHGGRRLIAHELTHVVQQRQGHHSLATATTIQRDVAQPNEICYDTATPQPDPPASEPERHPTYEQWLQSFTGMTTFESNDTAPGATARNRFSVLGAEATPATRFGSTSTTPETEPVPTLRGAFRSGEEFIDHPTNAWVQNCLPPNLRATAYQLPSDCADIAVILRHVWLSAHNRTETYNGWTVGDAAGAANQPRALQLINQVSSGNVAHMVNAYATAQGAPMRDFDTLAPLLHPGDVLVWEHRHFNFDASGRVTSSRREGGHTQTINNIDREDSGRITAINVLQGNLPIFSDSATAILQHQGAATTDPGSPAGRRLRDLPGRRIEADQAISLTNIPHPQTGQDTWGSDDGGNTFTFLVVAGPPRAASRPAASAGRSRSLLDWRSAIARANPRTITGVLESLLQEARSLLEGHSSVAIADMTTLGQLMGERLRTLWRRDVGQLLTSRDNFMAIIDALRDDANDVASVTSVFEAFRAAFSAAAVPPTATPESRRIYTESSSVAQFQAPFAPQIAALTAGLARLSGFRPASALVTQVGTALWQAALDRAQAVVGADIDDRPLYWTRLRMIEEIRQFISRHRLRQAQGQQLIAQFEQASRGLLAASFAGATATQLRILISGFDPFGLSGAVSGGGTNMTIEDSNPSAAAVLGLNGQTLTAPSGQTALIQGVVLPVRYRDFDAGLIESFFGPFLRAPPPVSMIVTLSQGDASFDIERWAGRNRSTDSSFLDNEGAWSGGTPNAPIASPNLAPGALTLETGLSPSMWTVPGTRLNEFPRMAPDGTPIRGVGEGSGGGFLSNEIFYRVRLLQTTIGGDQANIPVGHLHIPTEDVMSREAIKTRVIDILRAALPGLGGSIGHSP